MRWIGRTFTAIVGVVLLAACGATGASDQRSEQVRQTSEPMTSHGTPEARLLGFLNAANKADLEGGRLAQDRGTREAVKTYGRQMETDHMQMLQDSEAAAHQLRLLPVMGPETQQLVADQTKRTQALQAATGKKFDQLYLSHEVETHQRVLQTAASLAGHTQDAQLKQLVANARPILEAHLKAAQKLMADEQ